MIVKFISAVPSVRVRTLNQFPIDPTGKFVMYWMTAYRRTRFNFALQRAVELANQLRKPLMIFEAIRCNYRWASDRFHQFMLDGMLDNAAATQSTNATYYAYVERCATEGTGLMESFASLACVIVTDDYPCFFHPALYRRIASQWHCAIELVDSNTIVPMRCIDRTFTVAHSYRRYMQKEIFKGMPEFPVENPLEFLNVPKLANLPTEITSNWPVWNSNQATKQLQAISLSCLPIDHTVTLTNESGGSFEAGKILNRFIHQRLGDYSEARNKPEQEGSSCLSAYLHFGHISPHEVFERIVTDAKWTPIKLNKPNGKMDGFWNMGPNAEAFMDQLMTWREIGFNMCWRERNYDRFESLPSTQKMPLYELGSRPSNAYLLLSSIMIFRASRGDFVQCRIFFPQSIRR